MAHYIRELEDELATLIDSLDPEVGAAKTNEWYTWRDRLMNFVVKKVIESYRNGREGITDTAEAGTAAEGRTKVEDKKAPARHGSYTDEPQRDYTPRGVPVNSQRGQPAGRYPEDRTARGRVDRR